MANKSDLYTPEHGGSEEERLVYHVIRASHSKPYAMYCTVCRRWFKRKEDKAAALRSLVKHCRIAHQEKDGKTLPLARKNDAKRSHVVNSATKAAASASVPAPNSGAQSAPQPNAARTISPRVPAQVSPIRPPSATLPGRGTQPKQPTIPVSAKVTDAPKCTPTSAGSSVKTTTPAVSPSKPNTSASSSSAARADSTIADVVPGMKVTDAVAQQATVLPNAETKIASGPTPAAMNAEGASASASTSGRAGASIFDVVIPPPTPAGYDAMIRAKNKTKERRKRGYLILPVKDNVRQVAAEAQQRLYDSTGLLFADTIFWAPMDEEECLKQMRSAIPDECVEKAANGRGGDFYLKVWAQQQFFRADMASLGYRFFKTRVRKNPRLTQVPPVESWLELRKPLPAKDRVDDSVNKKRRQAQPVVGKNQKRKIGTGSAAIASTAPGTAPKPSPKSDQHVAKPTHVSAAPNRTASVVAPVAAPTAINGVSKTPAHAVPPKSSSVPVPSRPQPRTTPSKTTPKDDSPPTARNAAFPPSGNNSRLSRGRRPDARNRATTGPCAEADVIDLT